MSKKSTDFFVGFNGNIKIIFGEYFADLVLDVFNLPWCFSANGEAVITIQSNIDVDMLQL